ncbi:SIMPL domain-containing protein [Leeia sp. TBRC 13508]|uniref:SIMPL domain-containing protein n=1 Tax=Leeia speluncae TaxID=2884804 RepID=A0ABS8D7L9_9NEIS|nr:SIMPL domain-containing protein [Leeia speluncae]MCB6183986.1 SIMPL domain-containing protein [Leeia speluncae]
MSTCSRFQHLTFAGTLAAGLVCSAFILGIYGKQAANANQQNITVKGLAEKPVQADQGVIYLSLFGNGATLQDALRNLREQRPTLQTFISQHGFDSKQTDFANEEFAPVFQKNENGEYTSIIDHYTAQQRVTLRHKDVQKIAKTTSDVLKLQENGLNVTKTGTDYLVSDLEAIKMSLIGSATDNAGNRANEFAKHGNIKVGSMRSASQGAFYILPVNGTNDNTGDYGGVYDKSTINKVARVVVTVTYNLE